MCTGPLSMYSAPIYCSDTPPHSPMPQPRTLLAPSHGDTVQCVGFAHPEPSPKQRGALRCSPQGQPMLCLGSAFKAGLEVILGKLI